MLRLATTFPDNKEIQSLIFKLYSSLTKDSYLRSLILKAIIALASVESYLFDQKQRSSLQGTKNQLNFNEWSTVWLPFLVVKKEGKKKLEIERQVFCSPEKTCQIPTFNFRYKTESGNFKFCIIDVSDPA